MIRLRLSFSPWSSRVALAAVCALIGAALTIPDADARRLGGGKGFGRQSPYASQPHAQPQPGQPAQAAPGQAAPGQRSPTAAPNRWLGPLAGLAAGLGIAALLSHLGLAGPLAEMLGGALMIGLLVLAAMWLWRMLRAPVASQASGRPFEPAYSAQQAAGARPGSVAATVQAGAPGGSGLAQRPPSAVPADFETEPFLRNAKVYFLRLQAAWDARDLADLRGFTSPEMFAEIRMQLQEDRDGVNRTEVEGLGAELLGIEDGQDDWLASVRFEGTIRETPGEPAQPFQEIWNLSKRKTGGSGWLLAGIQQVH